MTVSEIIEAMGGPAAVSRALKLPPTTVGNWKIRNSVPARWHAPLIAISEGKITAEQIVAAHASSEATEAA